MPAWTPATGIGHPRFTCRRCPNLNLAKISLSLSRALRIHKWKSGSVFYENYFRKPLDIPSAQFHQLYYAKRTNLYKKPNAAKPGLVSLLDRSPIRNAPVSTTHCEHDISSNNDDDIPCCVSQSSDSSSLESISSHCRSRSPTETPFAQFLLCSPRRESNLTKEFISDTASSTSSPPRSPYMSPLWSSVLVSTFKAR